MSQKKSLFILRTSRQQTSVLKVTNERIMFLKLENFLFPVYDVRRTYFPLILELLPPQKQEL